MQEVSLKVNATVGMFEIENYEVILKGANELVNKYRTWEITESELTDAKEIKANLNKTTKKIKDLFKIRSEEYLAPYNATKEKINTISKVFEEASNNLNLQIKAFDEKEDNAKYERIKAIYESFTEDKELIDLGKLFNPKWLNKAYKLDSIKEDIENRFTQIKNDISIIKQSISGNTTEVLTEYFATYSLKDALDNYNERTRLKDKAQTLNKAQEKEPTVITKDCAIYEAKFLARGTKEQLSSLSEYLKNNVTDYQNIE